MYCSKCGKEISDKDVFCSGCGTQIGNVEQPAKNVQENGAITFKFSEQEVKRLIFKLIYVALIYLIWCQSKKAMFEIDSYYWLNIDGLMDQVFSFKQYAGESVLIAKVCYWCFEIAIFGYIAAAILALIQKEKLAKTLSEIGFILHLPIMLYSLRGVMVVMRNWGFGMVQFSKVFGALSEEFWIYIALNIAIVIYGTYFFGKVTFSRQDINKATTVLKGGKVESNEISSTEWQCKECGKINAYYLHVCSCGCRKDKK